MKKFLPVLVAAFAVSSVVGITAAADEIRIGYVDMHKVLTESKAGKRVKAELEKFAQQRKEALVKDEQLLKKMQEAYEKDKLILSEAQKQEKQREFQQKIEAYQKAGAEATRELSQKEQDYAVKAVPDIRAIIRDLAQEEKLTLVFEKNEMPVLYAVDGPDLTERVLKKFDAKSGG